MSGSRLAVLVLAAAALGTAGCTKSFEGTVVKVVDGDSLVVKDEEGEEWRVRLAGVDAPEIDQPFGNVAAVRLGALVSGKKVEVRVGERREARVVVGTLEASERDVAVPLLNEGLAWIYPPQADLVPGDGLERYSAAQEAARKEKRGFWRDPSPVPPWQFRRVKELTPRADTLKR